MGKPKYYPSEYAIDTSFHDYSASVELISCSSNPNGEIRRGLSEYAIDTFVMPTRHPQSSSPALLTAIQPANHPANHPAIQPPNQPANQPRQPARQPASQACQPASQPANHPANQPASQPNSQTVSRFMTVWCFDYDVSPYLRISNPIWVNQNTLHPSMRSSIQRAAYVART